jgi:catechol 2,3-dioxygenase-like lactoylglutathione lyase family enzyme
MKIKLSSVHVDDQEKALRFYTEVLGFVTKADFSPGDASLAHGGLTRGPGRHGAATGAQR